MKAGSVAVNKSANGNSRSMVRTSQRDTSMEMTVSPLDACWSVSRRKRDAVPESLPVPLLISPTPPSSSWDK